MYLTIQAIVLRVTDYNDRDALLTVLTRNHGKLTVKVQMFLVKLHVQIILQVHLKLATA